jgi:U3 small nucleolar RNA-associated protein 16
MFSHIVTAAKGLFTRQESDETQLKKSNNVPTASSESTIASKPKMVTATRRRKISDFQLEEETQINAQQEVNGKRKSGPANSGRTESQRNKRRKRISTEAAQESENETPEETAEDTKETDSKQEEEKAAPSAKKHFRFDSEEPELPLETQVEETAETQQPKEDNSDDSSDDDDDAPETVDNSAQLSKIRSEAKKLERAKQLSVVRPCDFPISRPSNRLTEKRRRNVRREDSWTSCAKRKRKSRKRNTNQLRTCYLKVRRLFEALVHKTHDDRPCQRCFQMTF